MTERFLRLERERTQLTPKVVRPRANLIHAEFMVNRCTRTQSRHRIKRSNVAKPGYQMFDPNTTSWARLS